MRFSMAAVVGVMIIGSAVGAYSQEETKIRFINGGVLNGKAKSLPKPDYPAHLRDQGISATVTVEVEIDESGLVASAAPARAIQKRDEADVSGRSEPERELIEAAVNAARHAQFAPTLLGGVPVRIKGTLVYRFVSDKDAAASEEQVAGDVLNGKATILPKPEYPAAAKAVKAEGTVAVSVVIDEGGNVVESEPISGHPLLRSAAAKAAREAKFSPTILSGSPVKVKGVLVYNFVL